MSHLYAAIACSTDALIESNRLQCYLFYGRKFERIVRTHVSAE